MEDYRNLKEKSKDLFFGKFYKKFERVQATPINGEHAIDATGSTAIRIIKEYSIETKLSYYSVYEL